jgi:hypothetical protein
MKLKYREFVWLGAALIVPASSVLFGLSVLRAEPPPTAITAATQPTSRPVDGAVIDEQLVKKLLGGESASIDTVEATLQEMDRAASQIDRDADVGPRTQQVQRRVVDGIDQLIDQARRNRAAQAAPPPGKRQSERRGAEDRRARGSHAGRAGVSDQSSAGSRQSAEGGNADGQTRARGKGELERGWGFLPPRDRAEISQGFDVEFNAKYREEIIRYYRHLAEVAQESRPESSNAPRAKETSP